MSDGAKMDTEVDEDEGKVEESVTGSSSAAGGASGSSSGPRFELKKWNAVAMWSWDICADTCAICRNSLNEPSIEYQVNISFSMIDA